MVSLWRSALWPQVRILDLLRVEGNPRNPRTETVNQTWNLLLYPLHNPRVNSTWGRNFSVKRLNSRLLIEAIKCLICLKKIYVASDIQLKKIRVFNESFSKLLCIGYFSNLLVLIQMLKKRMPKILLSSGNIIHKRYEEVISKWVLKSSGLWMLTVRWKWFNTKNKISTFVATRIARIPSWMQIILQLY